MHVDPVVESDSNLLQTLGPGFDVLLEDLVVGGHFHRADVVHMIIHLGEQVVPASDQLALALIPDQLEFEALPGILDAINEVFKDSFTTCLGEHILHDLVSCQQVSIPQIFESQVLELSFNVERPHQLSPVLGLDRVIAQLTQDVIDFLVIFDVLHVRLVDAVLANPVWQGHHFIHFRIQSRFHVLLLIRLERCHINLVNGFPHFGNTGPDFEQVGLIFFQVVQLVCVSQLHVKQLLGLADTSQISDRFLNDTTKDSQLAASLLD